MSAARALRIGLAACAAWLVLVVLFWAFGPSAGAPASGWVRIGTLAGVLAPLGLIWLAVQTALELAELRLEAAALRARLNALDPGEAAGALAEPPGAPRRAEAPGGPAEPPRPAPPRAEAAPAARRPSPPAPAAAQPSLDLGAPDPVPVDTGDLIRALNFPDSPSDAGAVAALRAALRDPETARLIRAAQDVIMLLAARGVYMDDRPPSPALPGAWRRLAAGGRGPGLAGIAPPTDPAVAAGLAAALREDEVFRDSVHHFLRRWDRMLAQLAPDLDDAGLAALADTRSGRAFLMLAEASGIVPGD